MTKTTRQQRTGMMTEFGVTQHATQHRGPLYLHFSGVFSFRNATPTQHGRYYRDFFPLERTGHVREIRRRLRSGPRCTSRGALLCPRPLPTAQRVRDSRQSQGGLRATRGSGKVPAAAQSLPASVGGGWIMMRNLQARLTAAESRKKRAETRADRHRCDIECRALRRAIGQQRKLEAWDDILTNWGR